MACEGVGVRPYTQRRPEATVWHRVVREHRRRCLQKRKYGVRVGAATRVMFEMNSISTSVSASWPTAWFGHSARRVATNRSWASAKRCAVHDSAIQVPALAVVDTAQRQLRTPRR